MKSKFHMEEEPFSWDLNFLKKMENQKEILKKLSSCTSKEDWISFYLELKAKTTPIAYYSILNASWMEGLSMKKLLWDHSIDPSNLLQYSVIFGKKDSTFLYGVYYEYVERENNEDSFAFLNHYKTNVELFTFLNHIIETENLELLEKCLPLFSEFSCYDWVLSFFSFKTDPVLKKMRKD